MGKRSTSGNSVLSARLAAQLLSGAPAANVVDATRHLLAVQAQDPRAARLAIRVRTSEQRASAVDRALTEDRSLVITWANRGTLHLIAAEDEAFLHALTTPQLRSASDRRLAQEGVSPTAAERGIGAIVKALGRQGPLTRAQLRAVLEKVGVTTAGQAFVHVLFRATLDGLIVRGPMVGRDHAFVLVADWLGERPGVDLGDALAELARRYLAGHGPACDRDLAKWANVPLREARAGLQAIASELDQRADGLVDLPGRPQAPLPPPRLLGSFDPLLVGWESRAFLHDGAPKLIADNGLIRAVALVRGRPAGNWSIRSKGVELRLWERQSRATVTALEREAAAVEAYLEAD